MAVKPKPDIKTTFETGDRPTEAEFGDFIDSYVPIETDGAVGFMEVISTASSLARPTETLVAIATAGQGGKTGIIEVLATAEVTALPTGASGRQILSAAATASAQGHLGGGTVGVQIFETETTAAVQSVVGVVTASETEFGVVEIATQAEMEATTATDRAATPANAQFHPGVAKAWLKFDIAGTVNASENVSSVTDTGTGDWTVNLTTAFSSVDYGVTVGYRDDDSGANSSNGVFIGTIAVGSFQLTFRNAAGNLADPAAADDMHAVAFGDQ